MVPLDGSHTKYTDRVEIRAGWKTPFIWLWANAFYYTGKKTPSIVLIEKLGRG
jgi:hypothetical protein